MATLGYTSVGGSEVPFGSGGDSVALFGPYVAPENGSLTSVTIRLYVTTGAKVTLGVYGDASGSPSGLLADTAESTPTANSYVWHTVTLDSAVSIVSGSSYWFALAWTGGSAYLYRDGTAGYKQKSKAYTYDAGALPSTVGTPWVVDYSDQQYSVYGTYTAGGGSASIPVFLSQYRQRWR